MRTIWERNRDKEIGSRVRKMRTQANVTRSELARRMGRSLRTIQKYEDGSIAMTVSTMERVAHVLKGEPMDLLGYPRTVLLQRVQEWVEEWDQGEQRD